MASIDIQINNSAYKWNVHASLKNYNRNTTLEIRYIFLEAGMWNWADDGY
jgi:hypothetical protein